MIPSFTTFVKNGYVHHADAGWEEEHTLQNHTFVRVEGYNLEAAVAISYGCLLGCWEGLQWFHSIKGRCCGQKTKK